MTELHFKLPHPVVRARAVRSPTSTRTPRAVLAAVACLALAVSCNGDSDRPSYEASGESTYDWLVREARHEFGAQFGGVHVFRDSYCTDPVHQLFVKLPSEGSGQAMSLQEWEGFPVRPVAYSWDEMVRYQAHVHDLAEEHLVPLGMVGANIDLPVGAVRILLEDHTPEIEASIRAILGRGPWVFSDADPPVDRYPGDDPSGGCAFP